VFASQQLTRTVNLTFVNCLLFCKKTQKKFNSLWQLLAALNLRKILMEILNRYLKKRLVKKYIYVTAPALIYRYGALGEYTVLQLEKTTQACRFSDQYLPYAIAMFRKTESENTLKLFRIDQSFLEILRAEISIWFFDGYPYKTKYIMNLSILKAWRGGCNTD
jgi:hypothetical protein